MRKLFAIAVLLTTTIGLAPPAAADSVLNCQAGVRGSSAGPVTISGRSAFGGSVMGDIRPGDTFRVDWVRGQVKIGEWPWDPSYGTPGAGWNNLADNGYYPAPGVPKYSLVGTYNANGQDGYLGPGACFQYRGNVSTFIWLQINDDYPVDNSGSWTLVLRQFR